MFVLTSRIIVGLGYLNLLAPPEKVLRWIEGRMSRFGRLPHYVSIDQKSHGRHDILPTSMAEEGTGMGFVGAGQRLGE